jgi:hypothetical protein
MAAHPGPHPSAGDPRAFGLGKLDDALAETVGSHLEIFPDCRKVVTDLPGDDFLAQLEDPNGDLARQ